ncbi:MAG: proprotein convertase P-domain-containing protein [Phycisphaerales bacterium]
MKTTAFLLVLGAACAAAPAQSTFSYTGAPVPIPDSPDGTCGPEAVAAINVGPSLTVGTVTVSFYIPHPFQGDLTVSLTHVNSGRTVVLVDRPGHPGTLVGFGAANYGTTSAFFTLSDSAATLYDEPGVAAPGVSGATGPYKPHQALSAFAGINASGTWRLRVRDCAGMDTGTISGFRLTVGTGGACYANCDASTQAPVLNVADFSCFMSRYAAGHSYANCDGSTVQPVVNIADFSCYLQKYAAGCTAP